MESVTGSLDAGVGKVTGSPGLVVAAFAWANGQFLGTLWAQEFCPV